MSSALDPIGQYSSATVQTSFVSEAKAKSDGAHPVASQAPGTGSASGEVSTVANPQAASATAPNSAASSATGKDAAVFSSAAKDMAAQQQAASVAVEKLSADAAAALTWGPDLQEDWGAEDFLQAVEGGYEGSFSFTTKHGSKVGVSAGQNEDGTPSQNLYVTISRANGDTYRAKLDHSLRISETEDGVSFAATSNGTNADDIIISKGFAMSGGKGDDTLISVGQPGAKTPTEAGTMSGDEGDDTLVSLGDVGDQQRVSTGSGRDAVLMRSYSSQSSNSLSLGQGSNTVVLDTMHAGSKIRTTTDVHPYITAQPPSQNSFLIQNLDGAMDLRNQDENTIKAGTIRGRVYISGKTGENSGNTITADAIEGSINISGYGAEAVRNSITANTMDGRIHIYGHADNIFSFDKINGSLSTQASGSNTIEANELNGSVSLNDLPGADKTRNTIKIDSITRSLFTEGSSNISVGTINGGHVSVGGANNTAVVDKVIDGSISFHDGTIDIKSANSTSRTGFSFSKATVTADSLRNMFANNSTVTANSVFGSIHSANSTLDIGTVSNSLHIFDGNNTVHFGSASNIELYTGFGGGNGHGGRGHLQMTIDHMRDSRIINFAGSFDINIKRADRVFADATGLGDGSAKGKFHIDHAYESAFLGEGFSITNAEHSFITQNRDYWYAAQRYGTRFAMEKGEGAFGLWGALL